MTSTDLRSDTVTRPTPEMRRAMAEAEVGDDVWGEDPTVQKLEGRVADLLGFEAALFVPSGTMGNNLAIRLWTRPGDEVLCDARGHSFDWELAGAAALSGVLVRPAATERGLVLPEHIAAAAKPRMWLQAKTSLVILENTHNMAGGTAAGRDEMSRSIRAARDASLRVHVDGARLWNAAVARGESEADLVRGADSAMVGLSKGLCAPVGSLFVASRDAVTEARRFRKQWGGGWRQAGVLAAAGLVALDLRPRLAEDHEKARRIAAALRGARARAIPPETNIVVVRLEDDRAADVVRAMGERGVRISTVDPRTIRLVTHLDVTIEECERAGSALAEVLGPA
jgi:threonine aldolase